MNDKESGEIVFIILDRSMDVASPLMHCFDYGALVNDLL
jgi:hypothetical protein